MLAQSLIHLVIYQTIYPFHQVHDQASRLILRNTIHNLIGEVTVVSLSVSFALSVLLPTAQSALAASIAVSSSRWFAVGLEWFAVTLESFAVAQGLTAANAPLHRQLHSIGRSNGLTGG